MEDIKPEFDTNIEVKQFEEYIDSISDDIQTCMLSPDGVEVAAVIAGYVIHKSKCEYCWVMSTAKNSEKEHYEYQNLQELSRGGFKAAFAKLKMFY